MNAKLLQANPKSTKEKFSYPMRVDRGYVHGKQPYPILKTEEKNGYLFVYFQAELNGKIRIYIGVCERSVVIVHKTEVMLAKLAKEQDVDEYGAVCIGRPTRARNRAKIRSDSRIADTQVTPDTYETENYALAKKLADNILLYPHKKERDIAAQRIIDQHFAEIKRRELLEAEKERQRLGIADTETTVENDLRGISPMAAMC